MQFPKDFVCKHCCEIPPKRTLRKFPGKQIPKHVFEKVCPTRLLPPTSDRFLRNDFTNIPWRYLPKNNFHTPPQRVLSHKYFCAIFPKTCFLYIFPKVTAKWCLYKNPWTYLPTVVSKESDPHHPQKVCPKDICQSPSILADIFQNS